MKDDEFRKDYPALAKELEAGETQEYQIDGVRVMSEKSDKPQEPRTYIPSVVDYIRRCDTVSQALEIVDYLVKSGELTNSMARDIKRQLKSEGLRSFGTKKEKGHYLKFGIDSE